MDKLLRKVPRAARASLRTFAALLQPLSFETEPPYDALADALRSFADEGGGEHAGDVLPGLSPALVQLGEVVHAPYDSKPAAQGGDARAGDGADEGRRRSAADGGSGGVEAHSGGLKERAGRVKARAGGRGGRDVQQGQDAHGRGDGRHPRDAPVRDGQGDGQDNADREHDGGRQAAPRVQRTHAGTHDGGRRQQQRRQVHSSSSSSGGGGGGGAGPSPAAAGEAGLPGPRRLQPKPPPYPPPRRAMAYRYVGMHVCVCVCVRVCGVHRGVSTKVCAPRHVCV